MTLVTRQKGHQPEGTPEVFESRREVFWHFQERMMHSYRRYAETGESNSLVKSILVEYNQVHQAKAIDSSDVRAALTIPGSTRKNPAQVPEVHATKDSGFFLVDWGGRDAIRAFVDVAADESSRFWTCYSLSDADKLDVYFDRLAYRQPKLDRIWLWPTMLANIQQLGEFRGVGIDYDNRRIEKKGAERGESTNYFKFQIWGGPATRVFLEEAQRHNEFMNQAVLSKVRLKYSTSDEPQKFAIEDIKYNGKFTSRGPDFHSHQVLLAEVRDRYKAKVLEVERNYAISDTIDGSKYTVKGEPLSFFLPASQIENLDGFCDVVFSGGPPFHIWGLVDTIGTNDVGRVVHAVDMHTGSKLFFEVYPDVVTMYLYVGGCGNTVVRFFTNMQRMFGALVRGEDNEGRDIFKE